MQRTGMMTALSLAFLVGAPAIASAQAPEPQLVVVTELEIAPSLRADFETLHKNRNMRMEKGDVSFSTNVAVSEDGIYRVLIPLGSDDWASVTKLRGEINAMPAMDAGVQTPVGDVIERIEQAVDLTRPDLNYRVDNPRLADEEIGFVHELRLYLKVGTLPQAGEIIKRAAALRAKHGIRDPFNVRERIAGADNPMLSVALFARDAADHYAQARKTREMLGEEGQAIVRDMGPLLRRVENTNFTLRRDLRYEASTD